MGWHSSFSCAKFYKGLGCLRLLIGPHGQGFQGYRVQASRVPGFRVILAAFTLTGEMPQGLNFALVLGGAIPIM